MSKFNFTKVGGRKYKAWKEWKAGDTAIVEFKRTYRNPNSKYNVDNYECKYLEGTITEWKEGDIVGLNYCGSLNFANEQGILVPGRVLELVYEGRKQNDEGTEFHALNVAYDDNLTEEETEDYDL